MATPRDSPAPEMRSVEEALIPVIRWIRWGVVLAGGVILLALLGGIDAVAPQGHALPDGHVALDIMPVKPGGPAVDYAAYVPSTVVSVPANSLVTITIRNFDLDATPLQADSPYTHVQGTTGGVAYADGAAYTALPRTGIAHTFTIPELHLNVPIPGQSASGARYVTVMFSFHTGKDGAYNWRCYAPCGDGPDEQGGPMADEGYMRGTLFVER